MTSGLPPPPGPTTRTCCSEVPDAPTGLPGAALPPSPCIVFLLPPGGRTGGATMVLRFAYTCRSLFHMFGNGVMLLPSARLCCLRVCLVAFFFHRLERSSEQRCAERVTARTGDISDDDEETGRGGRRGERQGVNRDTSSSSPAV